MQKLSYKELREMWLGFLKSKGHSVIPGSHVIPENDASTLFTTAGMQPLVPYLLGQKHPAGTRLANIQRCIRTNDIDEVGDNRHLTFFEMMGNWSLGDYFKKEKVAWSFEFLTSPSYLGLDPSTIHVTCFEGDKVAPRDEECAKYWEQAGVKADHIWFYPKSENWWAMSSGLGPQGPCSEMFVELPGKRCGAKCGPACDCGHFTEVGNDVYMQYVVDAAGEAAKPAKQKNVDTGWGLERILCFVNGHKSVFETELFAPALEIILSARQTHIEGATKAEKAKELSIAGHHSRIIAEHVRASAVILADGVLPSNTGAGYVLRRLIRRAVRSANTLKIGRDIYEKLIAFYNSYLEFDADLVVKGFMAEVARFEQTLANGIKEIEKFLADKHEKGIFDGKTVFHLYETYGFPIELTEEIAKERGLKVDKAAFDAAKAEHMRQSQTASAGTFKGGLADSGVETTRLHTAAHILLATLREFYGPEVVQRGSNITPERLRFDFSLPRKLEGEELAKIERKVNEVIAKKLPITCEEMSLSDAKERGAHGTFTDKYGDKVKVYSIGSGKNLASMEICGGPHATNTSELGTFKIQKEEAVSAGVRRIKAILS